jgi:hypothetical protein
MSESEIKAYAELLAENERLKTTIGELEHQIANLTVAATMHEAVLQKPFPEGTLTYMVLNGGIIGLVSTRADCDSTAALYEVEWEYVPEASAVICTQIAKEG